MKKIASISLALSMAALAVSSAYAMAPRPDPLPEKQTLSIGNVKVGHLAPILLAEEDLKECNVNVETSEFVRYADARTAILSGSIDIAGVAPADLSIALGQGNRGIIGLTGVASSPKYLVVKNGVDIRDWSDIKDKKIGIAPGSAVWFQWSGTLQEKGIPYNTFKPINIQGGGTAFVQALERGDVDAVALWEPFETQAVANDIGYFADTMDYSQSEAVGAELGLLAASRNAYENKRDALKCFLWSYKKAEQELANDPDKFAEVYTKYTGLPLDVTRKSVDVIKLGGVANLEQLQKQAKLFHELGVIPKDTSDDIKDVWDTSLLEEVMN